MFFEMESRGEEDLAGPPWVEHSQTRHPWAPATSCYPSEGSPSPYLQRPVVPIQHFVCSAVLESRVLPHCIQVHLDKGDADQHVAVYNFVGVPRRSF